MTPSSQERRWLVLAFQILASLAVLVGLFRVRLVASDDLARMLDHIRSGDWTIVATALSIPVLGLLFASWKWSLSLEGTRFLDVLRLHWAGEFVSLAGPGSLGNDAYKIAVMRSPRRTAGLVVTIRLVGLSVALTLLALVWILGFSLGFGAFFALLISATVFAARRSSSKHRWLLRLGSVAALNYFVLAIAYAGLLRAAIPMDLRFSLVLLTAEVWATTLPLSYQGVGIREAIFALMGRNAQGIDASIVPLGALLSLTTISVRLLGAIPFFFRKRIHQVDNGDQ